MYLWVCDLNINLMDILWWNLVYCIYIFSTFTANMNLLCTWLLNGEWICLQIFVSSNNWRSTKKNTAQMPKHFIITKHLTQKKSSALSLRKVIYSLAHRKTIVSHSMTSIYVCIPYGFTYCELISDSSNLYFASDFSFLYYFGFKSTSWMIVWK